jgi:VanZ family protein
MERDTVASRPVTQRGQRLWLALRHPLLRWLPALAWMTLIFWFSAQSKLPLPDSDLLNLLMRKTAHFCEYGVLALSYHWALDGATILPTSRSGYRRLLALLLALLYAISDEYHQSWTPLRHPSPIDVLIDTAGAASALWLLPRIWRRPGADRGAASERGTSSVEPHG